MINCLIKSQCEVGEGPHWDAKSQCLLWVDMTQNQIYRYNINTKALDQWPTPKNVAAVFPTDDKTTDDKNSLLVLLADGLTHFDLDSQQFDYLCQPNITPGSVFNEAKQDSNGRIWAMTKAADHASPVAGLYCFTDNQTCQQLDDGFTIGNGLGFSPDNQYFYTGDSVQKVIYRYQCDFTAGTVSNREPLIQLTDDEGLPDGLCVDAQGNIWSAHWDGWAIACYSPEGKLIEKYPMPIQSPTSCCFGGENNQTLFITSANYQLTPEEQAKQPLAGAIFTMLW